jgi:hypothetical protein
LIYISKFILFIAREGDAKQSYLFLRNELPVRLASMMKEMGHLPPRLLEMPSVKTVNGWYGTSLHELHSFKDSQPTVDIVKKYEERFPTIRVLFFKKKSFIHWIDLLKFYRISVKDIQL